VAGIDSETSRADTPDVSIAPPGWHRDPYGLAALRWWDGAAWTAQTRENIGSVARRITRQLPWKAWVVPAVAIGVAGVILFGRAEDKTTSDPSTWYIIGFAAVGAIILVAACLTLARRSWLSVAIFAVVAACASALALFTVTAPSTSRSCNNSGQPTSAGTYDCDTSDGLGGPLLVGILFVPSAGVASAGKFAGDSYYFVRCRIALRRVAADEDEEA
jgi:hypothetical protein